MSVKILSIAKQLPKHVKETKEIIPFVEQWMQDQESRFKRKVLKIFEGAGVDRRYSIMDAEEVFLNTSFEEKNDYFHGKSGGHDSVAAAGGISRGSKKNENRCVCERCGRR